MHIQHTTIRLMCRFIGILLFFLLGVAEGNEVGCKQSTHDFGISRPGSQIRHSFLIYNKGEKPLALESIRFSCKACITAELSTRNIPPDGNAVLEVLLDLKDDDKQVQKTIFIGTDHPRYPFLVFRIHGTVGELKETLEEPTHEKTETYPKENLELRFCQVVFLARDCDDCQWLLDEFLPTLPPVKTFAVDIETDDGYRLLSSIETALEKKGGDFPVLLAGTGMYHGRKTIEQVFTKESRDSDRMPDAVDYLLETNRELLVPLQEFETQTHGKRTKLETLPDTEKEDHRKGQVLVFTQAGCRSCARLTRQLTYLKQQYSKLVVKMLDAENESEAKLLQYAIASELKVPAGARFTVPMVVSGSQVLWGKDITDNDLEELLKHAPLQPLWQTWDSERRLTEARKEISGIASSISLPMIILAGLADGINPCVFAVMTFLVSCLTLSGNTSRNRVFAVGFMFCLGVFVFYFATGIGLLKLLGLTGQWRGAEKIISAGTATFCFLFAAGALFDAFVAKQGNGKAMRFGMPRQFGRFAHSLIRLVRTPRFMLPAAFVIGFIVSGVEVVCTGQIYLPVLVIINKSQATTASMLYLLLYNLCFCVPMLALVCVTGMSLNSKSVVDWGKRHSATAKLLLGIMLIAMGMLLVLQVVSS